MEWQKKLDDTGRADTMMVDETDSSGWTWGVRPYGKCRTKLKEDSECQKDPY